MSVIIVRSDCNEFVSVAIAIAPKLETSHATITSSCGAQSKRFWSPQRAILLCYRGALAIVIAPLEALYLTVKSLTTLAFAMLLLCYFYATHSAFGYHNSHCYAIFVVSKSKSFWSPQRANAMLAQLAVAILIDPPEALY